MVKVKRVNTLIKACNDYKVSLGMHQKNRQALDEYCQDPQRSDTLEDFEIFTKTRQDMKYIPIPSKLEFKKYNSINALVLTLQSPDTEVWHKITSPISGE